MFQFLIGTLKTNRPKNLPHFHTSVSIPHRYAENFVELFKPIILFLFQFLIGTLRTIDCVTPRLRISRVSIPHRYAENHKLQTVMREA